MYIKSMKIESVSGIIRDITFHNGLNLIIDNTPIEAKKTMTGNNVGKTTVLKLVDVCFGANPSIIYQDIETRKNEYDLVKKFLEEQQVSITLELVSNFIENKTISIKRNFLKYKNSIREINGEPILDKDFEKRLLTIFFPTQKYEKPTFRQIISHNNRYTEKTITNTLKTLDHYSKDIEYESLYLYLLGCNFEHGDEKYKLGEQRKQEERYKARLENGKTKKNYETFLKQIEIDIEELDEKKTSFGVNTEFENDLENLDTIKYNINKLSSEISSMNIRKNLIEETVDELKINKSNIDFIQLRKVYEDVKKNINQLERTFEELVDYHNKMIVEKIKFISSELPDLEQEILKKQKELNNLLDEEKNLVVKISKKDSFTDLEDVIAALNDKYRQKGEYETKIQQIESVEKEINDIDEKLTSINSKLFSEQFEKDLNERISRFNKIYSAISTELYNEQYVLTCDKTQKKGKTLYEFKSFNTNMSSGKKQGEILCFDLAYILYARQENIPCFDFLLNDKKELLHGNQLEKVAEFVKNHNIQLIIPILKDKLPKSLIVEENIVLELSQHDKLFRIENA